MQRRDLGAVVSLDDREGFAILVKPAREVQQEVADALILVWLAEDTRQRRVDDALAPAVVELAPVIAGTHRHGLRIGGDARLDHRPRLTVRLQAIAGLPPVPVATGPGAEPALRQEVGAGTVLAFCRLDPSR